MSLEVTGKLYKKLNHETRGEKGFRTRDFILEVPDRQYSELIKFQTVQDFTDALDNFVEGDEIKVHFNLKGREWNEKFLTNLNAWRIEKSNGNTEPKPLVAQKVETKAVAANKKVDAVTAAFSLPLGESDDLPF